MPLLTGSFSTGNVVWQKKNSSIKLMVLLSVDLIVTDDKTKTKTAESAKRVVVMWIGLALRSRVYRCLDETGT